MLGVSVPSDFSERIWTTLSFASSPTCRLPSLTSWNAVISLPSAAVARVKEATAKLARTKLPMVFRIIRFIKVEFMDQTSRCNAENEHEPILDHCYLPPLTKGLLVVRQLALGPTRLRTDGI